MTDEIMAEIHTIKDREGDRYRDLAAMMRTLRLRQSRSGRRIIGVPATAAPRLGKQGNKFPKETKA